MALVRPTARTASENARPLRIVARSIFRELLDAGFGAVDAMAVATELLDQVARSLRERAASPPDDET